MKKIILKATKIPMKESVPDGPKLHRRDLLITIMKNIPDGGLELDEMSKRLKVIGKIQGCANSLLQLEDAEYDNLMECLENIRWNFVDQDLEDFANELKALGVNGETPKKPKKKRSRQR